MLAASLLLVVVSVAQDHGAATESLAKRVNRAIDQGCIAIVNQQAADGSWGADDKVHPLGRTALALLTLQHAESATTQSAFDHGLRYLLAELRAAGEQPGKGRIPARHSTYETGLMLLLMREVGTPECKAEIRPLAELLVATFDRSVALWGYPESSRDLSNTHYALLGLRAALRENVRPAGLSELLPIALHGALRMQTEDGGFCYGPGRFASSSMTVAGLTVLQFLQEELKGAQAAAADLGKCSAIVKQAQAWLERTFDIEHNIDGKAKTKFHYFYYLYALERYAAFYAIETIAGHDWYAEGARCLLDQQAADGAFGADLTDTCFAILFLRRAAFTEFTGRRIARTEAIEASTGRSAASPPKPEAPRPRANIPFLREWLVAGTFAGKPQGDDALETDFIQEKKASALANQKAGSKAAKQWTPYLSPEDKVDLEKVTRGADHSATYAFLWVQADTDRDVTLWLASDDGVRVFLNGDLVFDHHHHDGVPLDSLATKLALKAGWNKLMLKVEDVGYFCYFFARMTDASGAAPTGITCALSPFKK